MIFKLRTAKFAALSLGLFLALGCTDAKKGRAPLSAAAGGGSPVAPTTPIARVAPTVMDTKTPIALGSDELLVSILGTNDIHGAIEPRVSKDGKTFGGMAFWAGAVKAVRDGVAKEYGDKGGVLVLDGGDQFQGTLLSNYSEGALMFSLLGDVGYDAMVPGNHDYDFGPEGWLVDQVTPDSKDKDPRGVIKKLANSAPFPLLSSNAYVKASIRTFDGKPATIDSQGCGSDQPLDWSRAERPEFLKSYLLREVAGLRVAIIGLDNPITPTTTTPANVSDLCFRDAAEEYKSVRESLEGKADLFVLVIHDGDINNEKNLTNLLVKLEAYRPDAVDAVIGGHTHQVNKIEKNGVYAIQSGSSGAMFGRIDLVVDAKTKKVVRTRAAAGAMLFQSDCDSQIKTFCELPNATDVNYEHEKIAASASALAKIEDGKKDIAPMTGRNLGYADATIAKDPINESGLVNLLTDAYRRASGADVAMINTGGVRTSIAPGPFTYEALYAISPFNNRAVVLGPVKVSTLLKIVSRAAKSCGKSGPVLASGIRVTYERGDCKQTDADGNDPQSRVVTIALADKADGSKDGKLLYDARDPNKVFVSDDTVTIATLDFLEAGGSGYVEFKEAPRMADLGIFRELVADELAKNPGKLEDKLDGRYRNLK
ncbi:MAG: 5'-nucleotidase C-terminal domain-containing protein [Bdellovibrionales bacterium]|nr:5'-nucleotidase C-terminal domain-containing protein [Bdellovibrionales bacterium]